MSDQSFSFQLPLPDPTRAYLPIAAARPETLREAMLRFHVDSGFYGVPFWIDPQLATCMDCWEAIDVFMTSNANFEASVPAVLIDQLAAQTIDVMGAEVLAYKVVQGPCAHISVLAVPDTLYALLEPLCDNVTVIDDTHIGQWLPEPETLIPALDEDQISLIQLAAIGLDLEDTDARTALVTDVPHLNHITVPPTDDMRSKDKELAVAVSYLGNASGTVVWAEDYPVRLRDSFNSWYANSEYDDDEVALVLHTLNDKLVFSFTRNISQGGVLHVEAVHDPHLARRTRYLGGDTLTLGPTWVPGEDEQFCVEIEGTSPYPFTLVGKVSLPPSVEVKSGDPLIGRVSDRELRANPWSAGLYWYLTLVVAENDFEAHYLRVMCPYEPGQRVREGECVELDGVLWTGRVTPS